MRRVPDKHREKADNYLARYYDRAGDVDSFMAFTADSRSFDDDICQRRLSYMLSEESVDWQDVCDELNAMRQNGFTGETEFLDLPQNAAFKDFYDNMKHSVPERFPTRKEWRSAIGFCPAIMLPAIRTLP